MNLRRLLGAANRARLSVYLLALWKLFKHPQTPRAAKWIAIFVVAYALSPIDLIPDFIPVLGMLDELILLPLGVALVVRLTPAALWQARLAEAEASRERVPRLLWGLAIVVAVWAVLLALLGWWVWATWGAA
ncbi:MAG TPA: YkvA family protein [Methylibium sp.]|uniref:YkvA family protein n=1 Tax=Methylibium sp. TaxID=2067992 RepID=UPI002DC021FE|nr:YkvA family protein [Methylibium sp.]HEU4458834.1 YkvA family protein [Methylibium sp.]